MAAAPMKTPDAATWRAPFVLVGAGPVDDPLADVEDESVAELVDEGAVVDEPESDCAALLVILSVAARSSGNLIGFPPADMSTLPSAEMVSGFIAKSVRAYMTFSMTYGRDHSGYEEMSTLPPQDIAAALPLRVLR